MTVRSVGRVGGRMGVSQGLLFMHTETEKTAKLSTDSAVHFSKVPISTSACCDDRHEEFTGVRLERFVFLYTAGRRIWYNTNA